MKKEVFSELLQSAREAAAIERGTTKPSRKFKLKAANKIASVQTKVGVQRKNRLPK